MENYREEISSFTNKELKDNIIKLNKEKLEEIKRSSYLNGFNSIISLKTVLEKEKTSSLKHISESNTFKRYVNKAIKLINNSLEDKKWEEGFLEEALEIRNNLHELSKAIQGYFIELSYVEQGIEQHRIRIEAKSDSKVKNLMDLNLEDLTSLIENALEASKGDYENYNYIISAIVYSLPMRLTRDKYFNTIKRALIRNLENLNKSEVEDRVNYYKRQWDSSLQYGYGIHFGYYFAEIERFKKKKFNEKSLEELNEISEELKVLTGDLNELYNFVLILGLTYNMIISILLSQENDSSDDLEELWGKWKKAIDSNNDDTTNKFLELNKKAIQESEKTIVSSLSEFEELNKEALRREDFDESQLNTIFFHTKKILTYYNDYNLSNLDLLLSNDKEETSPFYLDQSINSLIQYMSRTMVEMPNLERKVRMKKLLSLVELPFRNIEEFKDYIKYSLDKRNTPEGEIKIITNYIVNFLSSIKDMDKN